MNSIAYDIENEKSASSKITHFFQRFHVRAILRKCNVYIEVFFKTSKSVLKLTDECRSISYDAMCAQTAIVFARYIFLAMAMREKKDDRSIGPLFYEICDEIADITFEDALKKLELFWKKLVQQFNGISVNICALIAEFIADLPADLVALLDFTKPQRVKS